MTPEAFKEFVNDRIFQAETTLAPLSEDPSFEWSKAQLKQITIYIKDLEDELKRFIVAEDEELQEQLSVILYTALIDFRNRLL